MVDYKKQVENMIQDLKQENSKREISFSENYVLDINGLKIDVSILNIKEPMEKDDEKTNINKIQIFFKTKDGYVLIAEKIEEEKIIINEEGLEEAGLADLISIDKLDKIELREKKEHEKDLVNKSGQEGEKPKEELEEPDNEKEEQQRSAENENVTDKSNWIEIDLSKEIVEGKTLKQLIPNAEKYKELYVVPGKDEYSYTIQGGDEKNGYKVLDELESTEGRAPNQKIMSIDSERDQVDEKRSLAMFKFKGQGDEGTSISRLQDGTSQLRVEYWRKSYNDMYISTTVPQSNVDRGLNIPDPEVSYFMAKERTPRWDMEKIFDNHEDIKELEDKDIPENANPAEDGIQLEELDRETFKERMIEKIEKELEKENGNQIEGFYRKAAEKITNKVIDEGQRYEEAKEEVVPKKAKSDNEYGENEDYSGYGQKRAH